MRRSSWSVLISIFTILTILTAFFARVPRVQAAPPVQRARLFVFIQGLNTHLDSTVAPEDTFGKTHGIASALSTAYPGSSFLMYSYAGDTDNGNPLPYQCQDTFTSGVTKDAFLLEKQLQDYLRGKQDMDIYLVAHSFGGLVAYGYLSYLVLQHLSNGVLPGTMDDRIAGIVTLDSPLGGVEDELHFSRILLPYLYTAWCPGLIGHAMPAIDDLFNIYKTGTALPHGGKNRASRVLFDTDMTNQAIALAAAAQSMHVLTIGNQDDYLYDPAACKFLLGLPVPDTDSYLSTQWLADAGNHSGVYGRYFADGKTSCDGLTDIQVNHGMVFSELSIQTALEQFVNNQPITALAAAPNTL